MLKRKLPVRPRERIRGKTRPAPKETVVFNPATGARLGAVRNTDFSGMDEIFAKAREAQALWADMPFRRRRRHVLMMMDYIIDNAEHIAGVIAKSTGKTRIDALATEVIPSALSARWYANRAGQTLRTRRVPASSLLFINKRNMIARAPWGVVGIISPWNYPFSIPFGEVAMGLMAGNAVMLKVATVSVLIGLEIEKIIRAGDLPDGLFTLVTGPPQEVSDAFFRNRIDKIFFTGSVATGKILMARASRTLTPLSLELGGKDAMIVLPDADLERASNGAAWAGYSNAGQSCAGLERLYVHESVYDEFMKLLSEKTRALRVGVDTACNVDIGSLSTREQLEKVKHQVAEAGKRGAVVVARSEMPKNPHGWFYPATLMAGVDHSMELMREETFGPVIPVMKFSDVSEAVRLANDSTMGLTASIWSRNTREARRIAGDLQAGVVTINDHLYTHGQPESPWLGWKNSGIGVTHSDLGLLEMTHPRVINWDVLPSKRDVWWYPYDRSTYDGLLATMDFIFPQSFGTWLRGGVRMTAFLVRKMFSPWRMKGKTGGAT